MKTLLLCCSIVVSVILVVLTLIIVASGITVLQAIGVLAIALAFLAAAFLPT